MLCHPHIIRLYQVGSLVVAWGNKEPRVVTCVCGYF